MRKEKDSDNMAVGFCFQRLKRNSSTIRPVRIIHNYFRNYDPQTGRYVESDPIGLAGGSFSTYSYVNNNPAGEWDEEGLASSGGPYHPPDGTGLKCTGEDSCTMLSGKMWVLMRMINSHQLWDWINPL